MNLVLGSKLDTFKDLFFIGWVIVILIYIWWNQLLWGIKFLFSILLIVPFLVLINNFKVQTLLKFYGTIKSLFSIVHIRGIKFLVSKAHNSNQIINIILSNVLHAPKPQYSWRLLFLSFINLLFIPIKPSNCGTTPDLQSITLLISPLP